MTNYTGKSMTLTIGGNSITCLTSVDHTEQADIAVASCAGQSYKSKAVGNVDGTMTVNGMLDTTNGTTVLGYLAPGTTGAASLNTGNTTIAYADSVVVSRQVTSPADNFVVFTSTIGANGAITAS